ncbi:MAG: hypothetical protein ACD_37C00546G0001, partial [uncultured bacterium]
ARGRKIVEEPKPAMVPITSAVNAARKKNKLIKSYRFSIPVPDSNSLIIS